MIDPFGGFEALPRWLAWREETRGSARALPTKVPYNPNVGGASFGYASSTNPATWGTHSQAGERARQLDDGRKVGCGTVLGDLGDDTYLSGADLDSSLDENSAPALWAVRIISVLQTYAEVSPSGRGLKAFFRIAAPDVRWFLDLIGVEKDAWGCKRGIAGLDGANHGPGIEIYTSARYFTVTGRIWSIDHPHIVTLDRDRLAALAALIPSPTGGIAAGIAAPAGDSPPGTPPRPSNGADSTRSAKALSAALALMPDTYDDMVKGLREHPDADIAAWVEDKGEAHNERELKRLWGRFVVACAAARAAGLADLEARIGTPQDVDPDPTDMPEPPLPPGDDGPKPNGHDHGHASTDETSWGEPAEEQPWPEIEAEAFDGLAGDIVHAIENETEADPIALLVSLLVMIGNMLGRGPHALVGRVIHRLNLFAVFVGETARGRKGTSEADITAILAAAESDWVLKQIESGLSSGEGVIWRVHDEIVVREKYKTKDGKAHYENVVKEPNVEDKRLMIVEPEFAGTLAVMKRDGSILSRVLRDAWDGRRLATLTKNANTHATGAHISMLCHITADDLRASLDRVSFFNGYANRYLFVCVKRSRLLPFGGVVAEGVIVQLADRLREMCDTAQAFRRPITFDKDAAMMWAAEYRTTLSIDRPGLLGAVTARAEAHTLRLAILYAALDSSLYISRRHLLAALAVWRYCEASARCVFGDAIGDPFADEVRDILRKAGQAGMTRTELSNFFGRNRGADDIGKALRLLLKHNKVLRRQRPSNSGRPPEIWVAP